MRLTRTIVVWRKRVRLVGPGTPLRRHFVLMNFKVLYGGFAFVNAGFVFDQSAKADTHAPSANAGGATERVCVVYVFVV